LKKAAQKFLRRRAKGCAGDNAHGPALKKFFASFRSPKEAFPFACRNLARFEPYRFKT
jgi:hypothetical protein